MITRLQVSNYRALREVTCSLERFTVIVGPNGCGKSTLLEVLERTATLRGTSAVTTAWDSDIEDSSRVTMTVTGRDGGEPWERSWVARTDKSGGTHLLASWMHRTSNMDDGSARHGSTAPSVGAPVRFDQASLRAPTPLQEPIDLLTPEGAGLAGLLADWKLSEDPRLALMLEQLRRVVPHVRSVLPRRTGRGFELFLTVGPEARLVPARHASTGTLYALALLTLLQSLGGRSALILVDDIDQDLHPAAQADLVAVLRKVLEVNPDLQIVATSHSPYFLDHMKAEEVRLMTLDEQGFSHLANLTDHPEFERWRGVMMPGEFWSSVGESWILSPSGSPAPGGE
jgi:predicted ATPase